ncbi:MAG TPA: hypothetical protein VEC16_01835 [Alphaproteobacteria bacterium]|nr:hypothetical protein [Alphaproteobacteria bacterium]
MITLVGTAFIDLNGYDRLTNALGKLKPNIIGIDFTEESYLEHISIVKQLISPRGIEIIKHVTRSKIPNHNPQTIDMFLENHSLNYIEKAVHDYSTKNNATILFCDNEDKKIFAKEYARNNRREILREIEKIFTLSPEEAVLYIEKEYYDKENHPSAYKKLQTFFNKTADKHAEKILRQAEGNIVYVSSVDRVYGAYMPNIFDRMGDLNLGRVKLNDL